MADNEETRTDEEQDQVEAGEYKNYPFDDGDFIVLGPEIFTGQPGSPADGVISWKGENFYRTHDGKPPVTPKERDLQPALTAYRINEEVEVDKNGVWMKGRISSAEKGNTMLNVDTERGPVSVGSKYRIRKI